MALAPAHIIQLPTALANQIAAGEVIERPAAVVKELVENSLDAHATRIVVRAEDGGRRLVEVEDDGCGIHADELGLALARHATSKLRFSEDLFRISTLGFRGEALPSIAAVSEFTISSRPHDSADGQQLEISNRGEPHGAPCAMAPGTRISVRNLFWNVPARLKFLKSEASENGHLTEQVIRLALSHPAVGFRLEIAGRTVLDLAHAQLLPARVRDIFGRSFTESLLAVAHSVEGMQVTGYVAHPREAKPTAKRQYCFLNGRWVRDKLLLAAVREGFKGFLEPRLHGAVILHLDVDPAQVDVNVHPTKSEVRFRRQGEVFSLVSRAISATVSEHSGDFSLLTPADAASARDSALLRAPVARAAPAASSSAPSHQQHFLAHQVQIEPPAAPMMDDPAPAPDSAHRRESTPVGRVQQPHAGALAIAVTTAPGPLGGRGLPRGVRRVLQLHRMFLLIETDTGMRLVDQHALHEKALFLALDEATGDLTAHGSQQLLVPRTIDLTATEVVAVEALLPGLRSHGIEAEVFGPTTILVRASPPRLRRLNWSTFFAELAAGMSQEHALGQVRERIRHSAACHGAVKAGQELSSEEQLELVTALYQLEGMEHCPHGRPTTLDLSWAELARRFQR